MKDKIAQKIAWILPSRIVLWVIVRAFAYTSTTPEYSNRTPDSLGYSDIYKSWDKKLD